MLTQKFRLQTRVVSYISDTKKNISAWSGRVAARAKQVEESAWPPKWEQRLPCWMSRNYIAASPYCFGRRQQAHTGVCSLIPPAALTFFFPRAPATTRLQPVFPPSATANRFQSRSHRSLLGPLVMTSQADRKPSRNPTTAPETKQPPDEDGGGSTLPTRSPPSSFLHAWTLPAARAGWSSSVSNAGWGRSNLCPSSARSMGAVLEFGGVARSCGCCS